MIPSKKHDYGLDNIKGFCIVLVVLGHTLTSLGFKNWQQSLWGDVYAMIFAFHMPMFVFVSGMLSSKNGDYGRKAVISCLIPYVIFNLMYILINRNLTGLLNFFTPQKVMWYLLSLFFWRVLTPAIVKIRGSFFLILLLALYIGLTKAGTFFSFSRTVVFYPFFLLGYLFPKDKTDIVRAFPKWITVISILVILAAVVVINRTGFYPSSFYFGRSSYASFKFAKLEGIGKRAVMLLLSFGLIFGCLSMMPDKNGYLAKIGRNSMTVYVFHLVLIMLLKKILTSLHVSMQPWIISIVIVVYAGLVVWLLSMNSIALLYQKIMAKVNRFLVKE